MLKQIKTLGLVLIMGSMLVGCDNEVSDIKIEDTNPSNQEQQVDDNSKIDGISFDLITIDKYMGAGVDYNYLTKNDIKTIKEHAPEFIELGKKGAGMITNNGVNFPNNTEAMDLAESYENEFETENAFWYLYTIYEIALVENNNNPEVINVCRDHNCDKHFITDKYTELLDCYPSGECGCEYDGDYINNHSISTEEAYKVLENDYGHKGLEIIKQDNKELVVLCGESTLFVVDLETRIIDVQAYSCKEDAEKVIHEVYNPNWVR